MFHSTSDRLRPSTRNDRRTTVHLTTLAGAALTGVALTGSIAFSGSAAYAGTDTPLNEQVALVNVTEEQLPFKSHLNGTAQVTSHDGQFTVFSTVAPLVPWDDNGTDDVYLRDAGDDVTVLVSARDGKPGNDSSFEPTISADGRYVAFTTWATDLKRRDRNGSDLDVLVKDMQTDRLRRVSVTSKEEQGGRNSFSPVISDDGRSVSFQTFSRLGRRDDDRKEDVYVRDLDAGVTRQGSLLPSGRDVRGSVLNGDLSGDGSVVVFGNANRLWARDVRSGETTRFWREPDSPPCQSFPAGSAGRPVISGNGRYAAFASCATSLPGEDGEHTDVYRVDLVTGDVVRAHRAGNGNSYLPSLSRSGRHVGFGSEASNLVRGDTAVPDAFVADLRAGTVVRASQAADGTAGNLDSARNSVAISGDGRSLAYVSYASNLVEGDVHDLEEAFAWRR